MGVIQGCRRIFAEISVEEILEGFKSRLLIQMFTKTSDTNVRTSFLYRNFSKNYSTNRLFGPPVASNQKEAVSRTVWSWHMKILLRISTAWKVWDFDFLRGLAPGRLDGFSIERYETNRVPFGLSVGRFKS